MPTWQGKTLDMIRVSSLIDGSTCRCHGVNLDPYLLAHGCGSFTWVQDTTQYLVIY
ncbi:hypothetical protein SCLCIDRAFT_1221590 [Scleroderma citrinum Foug A]|uniref:Uncharacterized protein n=1 Tax=Scleroderma citrinum Foug A TaxID=1036808 RepID=A0A0C3D227_9AGAM|nr:hypothetical protein SCLCIDRAFT_1221590 [Scleroderma citrinum Foug A]